jgi:spore coat protein U-like protein
MNKERAMLRRMMGRLVLALGLGLLAMGAAQAQCTTGTSTPVSFGTLTSFVVDSTQQTSTTPNAGISCGNGGISLVSNNHIFGTPTSASGGFLVGPTGDKVPYLVYASTTIQIPFGTQYDWGTGGLLILGSTPTPIQLWVKTVPGANVASGTYTDTLTLSGSWSICTGIGAFGVCLGTSTGNYSLPISISLAVTNDCVITAPDISFGSAPVPSAFAPVSGNLSLVCTKGMSYTVGLSAGVNPAANGRRQMASGANRLQYDIYSSGGAIVWGDATNRVGSPGAADGTSAQAFPYQASIYTDQPTPPVGTYTDMVIINVRY